MTAEPQSVGARQVAAKVLLRVMKEGAYAAAALSSELERAGLSSLDRALSTELVYGVLRTEAYLRRRLQAFGKIKVSDLQLLVRLLLAVYQIDFLDRVPARAAVFEAVAAVAELRGKKVSGFANAILRAVSDSRVSAGVSLEEAVLQSTPSWLRKRLERDVGKAHALSLLAPSRAPRPHLRLLGAGEPLPFMIEECSPCPGAPGAYLFEGGGDPRVRPGFTEGRFVVQELGAQMVTHALEARPGERVLDVCAGRGQKAALLKELVGPSGDVVATDLYQHKLSSLNDECRKLGLDVQTQVWDFTQPPPEHLTGCFDRVLVDAPCTGVGTLRRRPEIARRLQPSDPGRLAELQGKILSNAILSLRPGGVLLFATCSVFAEEGDEVVKELFGRGSLPLQVAPFDADSPLFSDGSHEASTNDQHLPAPSGDVPVFQVRLLPLIHGTDGYFLARLRRA